jgi:integrase
MLSNLGAGVNKRALFADFHSLRHTLATNLARAGVPPPLGNGDHAAQ